MAAERSGMAAAAGSRWSHRAAAGAGGAWWPRSAPSGPRAARRSHSSGSWRFSPALFSLPVTAEALKLQDLCLT